MGSTGKQSSTTATPGTPTAPQGAPQSSQDMGTPNIVPTATQAQTANAATFSATDDGDFRDFKGGRQYYQSQTFDVDTRIAIQDYLYDQPVDGTLYSPSQLMNHNLKHGGKLSPQEQFVKDSLMEGMHNLGYNMNLEHYGAPTYLDAFGQLAMQQGLANKVINASNFEKMSESELKAAFTGLTYTESGFLSTSYNHFSHAGNQPFTDRVVKINVKAPARTQALMPGNGPGGALGEIVLAPEQNYRITDVRFTGKKGRWKSNSNYKQIEFDVEIF